MANPRAYWRQDFELDGSCAEQMPPMTAVGAKCDYTADAIAGSRSARLVGSSELGCEGCIDPEERVLWVEISMRLDATGADGFDLLWMTKQAGEKPLGVGAFLFGGVDRLAVHCVSGEVSSSVFFETGVEYILTFSYDWMTDVASVWLRDAAQPTARGEPAATAKCAPAGVADTLTMYTYFSHDSTMTDVVLDDIVIANHAAKLPNR